VAARLPKDQSFGDKSNISIDIDRVIGSASWGFIFGGFRVFANGNALDPDLIRAIP
jgi:hypothetical protein